MILCDLRLFFGMGASTRKTSVLLPMVTSAPFAERRYIA